MEVLEAGELEGDAAAGWKGCLLEANSFSSFVSSGLSSVGGRNGVVEGDLDGVECRWKGRGLGEYSLCATWTGHVRGHRASKEANVAWKVGVSGRGRSSMIPIACQDCLCSVEYVLAS